MNPYEILGLHKNASDKEIKKRYRELAQKNHPDLNPNNEAASELFMLYKRAYEEIEITQDKYSFGYWYKNENKAMRSPMGNHIIEILERTYPKYLGVNKIQSLMGQSGGLGSTWIRNIIEMALMGMTEKGQVEYVYHKGYRLKKEA